MPDKTQQSFNRAQTKRDNSYEAEDYELESRRIEAEMIKADNEEDNEER